MSTKNNKLRVAAIADIHVHETHDGRYRDLFAEISDKADVLIISGDLTHNGSVREAENLAEDLRSCRIPVVGVLGNHDHHQGFENEIKEVVKSAGFIFLDDTTFEHKGVGFAGVKGFAGGFSSTMLASYGEEMMKAFVHEAVEEALSLENALRDLTTEKKVVALHYAPIWETLEGEPREIYAFLGCSRFAETIDRYGVDAVVHGHAHHGKLEGKTYKETPVYNCTVEVLKKNKMQYLMLEV